MRIILINIFLFVIFFSLELWSQKIVIVDIQSLIDNNKKYQEIINDIEINQQEHLNDFKVSENSLKILLNEIEESKLLLSNDEINLKVENYNNQLNNFQILVEDFNIHYQNQIIAIRETILKKIISILENYADKNKIDLVLDSTSYLIASNSLDITDNINNELNKIDFKLEYKNFEKN